MCMWSQQTSIMLVPSLSREVDVGLLPPSWCGRVSLQEVITLLQPNESWYILGPRTVDRTATRLSHLLGQGGHKSAHLCPSKVVCRSTSQEDRSPPVVCLGGLSPKTYFLDSRPLLPVVEGEQPLCFEVVFSIGCTGFCLCLWEVLLTWARKKNSHSMKFPTHPRGTLSSL